MITTITTDDHTQLITEAVAFMISVNGPALTSIKTVSQCVEAFADMILEDWLDLDTDERIEKLHKVDDSHVKHLLAADDLLKVDTYGDEAGLYE